MKRFRYLLAITLCVAGIGGTAALALAGPEAPPDDVFSVDLRDGAVEPEASTVSSGSSEIQAANSGSEEHELVILRTDRAPEDLAVGLHGVSIKYSGELVFGEDHAAENHAHDPGEVTGLLPGKSLGYAVDLRRGHYVAYCQTDGHYLSGGESAEFTVG